MDNYLNQVLSNRYEIKEIIGMGGMAVVYKAYDRVDDRIVAVKILKDEFKANEEFRLRFRNESKMIAMLSHPNIVKVFDVNFSNDLQYIVMEHIEGITLKEYIEYQKVLDWKEAVHIVIQILRALQHAHDRGITHRDIKPQNILILSNTTIKVTDFGIARFNRSEKNIHEFGAIGSVHYMCPEQAKGEQTDGRGDIYSVGVVLYEMLTGRVPFDSEDDETVVLMQMSENAVKPSTLNPGIPMGLEQIVLRAMQKAPQDRYQSAAEFLLDLDEIKKNPEITFDYSFFIDEAPTKHIAGAVGGAIENTVGDDVEQDDEEDEDEEESSRNLTIPILAGVAVALVLVVGLIVAVAFADPIKDLVSGKDSSSQQSDAGFLSKLDVFGWFSKDKVEVPNFLNMDYNEALSKYPDLIIENPPQYVYNSAFEDGHVCDQTPKAGDKVSPDTVIRLTVVTSSSMILIKDVIGLDYVEAETVLRSLGLTVELVPTALTESAKKENVVVNTVPSVNTYISQDSTVFVYYTSSTEAIGTSRVPYVIGDELAIAKAKITSQGLKVGAITYESSSVKLKDYVIGQTPGSYNSVKSGTYVNLVVGNGVPASATASFSVDLPIAPLGHGTGSLRIYLNNKAYDIVNDVSFDGESYEVSFTGSGTDNSFSIYADTTLICTGKIDFTTDPPTVSEVSSFGYSPRESIPNVTGLTELQARTELKHYGFNSVIVTEEYSDTVPAGKVIRQSPVPSNLVTYYTSTSVTLVISIGQNSEPISESTTAEPISETTNPIIEETTTDMFVLTTVPEEPTELPVE